MSAVPPLFSDEAVVYAMKEFYAFRELELSSIVPLDSWGDRNYYFKGARDETDLSEFVLKIYNWEDSSDPELIRGLADVMSYLHNQGYNCSYPIPATNGQMVLVIDQYAINEMAEFNALTPPHFNAGTPGMIDKSPSSQCKYCMIILHYVKGQLARQVTKSNQLYFNIGKYFGSINKTLKGLEQKCITERRYINFDLKYLNHIRHNIPDIQDLHRRNIYAKFIDEFEEYILKRLPTLSQGIIHNDANLMNIIIANDSIEVNGVIDFGDCVHSCHIFELGNIILDSIDDQFNTSFVHSIILGYSTSFALPQKDLQVLYYAVLGRLAQLCINGELAYNKSHNLYILETLKRQWKITDILLKVPKNDFDSIWKEIKT